MRQPPGGREAGPSATAGGRLAKPGAADSQVKENARRLAQLLDEMGVERPTAAQLLARQIEARFPRAALLEAATPLTHLRRLSQELGVEVHLKRDDYGSFAMAGAKARKLERIVAQAQAKGCTTLLTAGPGQSNTARAMTAACARTGLKARLMLRDTMDAPLEGNVLLAQMMGAEIIRLGMRPWPAVEAAAKKEAAADATTALVPMGATSIAGVAGMAAGYLEMLEQLREEGVEATRVYHASATGGIWAGLRLAADHVGGPRPHPVAVIADVYEDMPARYAQIYNETARALDMGERIEPGDVGLDTRGLSVPYGEPGEPALEAIEIVLRTEGILLDYVYTGRAAAALISDAKHGRLTGPVVLWHSGGLPGSMPQQVQSHLAAFAQRPSRRFAPHNRR